MHSTGAVNDGPAIVDGVAYVGTELGSVYALGDSASAESDRLSTSGRRLVGQTARRPFS